MNQTIQLVMFVVDGQRYALPLDVVERVTRSVEVTPLPEVPPIIQGAINLQGRVVPVLDLRKRFRLPAREIGTADHFVIARSSNGPVALPVDEALGLLRDMTGENLPAAEIVPNLPYVHDVFLFGPEMVFVLDIDTVLSDEEESALADSLRDLEDAPQ